MYSNLFRSNLKLLYTPSYFQILQLLNDPNPGVREAATACIEVIAVYQLSFLAVNIFVVVGYLDMTLA